jgi:hypothetical protein
MGRDAPCKEKTVIDIQCKGVRISGFLGLKTTTTIVQIYFQCEYSAESIRSY